MHAMNWLSRAAAVVFGAWIGIAAPALAAADTAPADPLGSPMWNDRRQHFLGNEPYRFDPAVIVESQDFADSPLQVPVTVDASALQDVKEILVFADLNPIIEILRFYPDATTPYISFRAKLQQTTPVRAAVKTGDGVWHLGGKIVNTVGGGCTAPSLGSGSPEWQQRLNEVSGRTWNVGAMAGRMRFRVIHPMDTGLVAGIPAFYLQTISISDETGKRIAHLQLSQPVSENPVFTVSRGSAEGALTIDGRDNNGNVFNARIR